MPAQADDRAAREVVDPSERLALGRQRVVLADPVAGLALADLLLLPGVERGALLLRPRALAVLATVRALDVEDRVARRTNVQPQRVGRRHVGRGLRAGGHEVDLVR